MFPISDSIKSGKVAIINITLISVTIFVFIQQLFTTNPDAFITHYALIPANVHGDNFMTLFPFITAIFLHGGFFHIITNMLFLWVFGDDVEGSIGHIPFLFLYIISGVIGNITQYLIMPASDLPMLGASGAVAGILGAYFILFPYAKIKTVLVIFGFITIVNISAPFMLGYWFILQIFSGFLSLTPNAAQSGGVAFFAHIGGFITGVIAAKLEGGKKPTEEMIWQS